MTINELRQLIGTLMNYSFGAHTRDWYVLGVMVGVYVVLIARSQRAR